MDVLTGNDTQVTTPLSATVTALSNNGSGNVRVTTAAPHYFGTNDHIFLSTTTDTGIFRCIAVVDSTHFDLQLTFTSSGTGTATDLSLTPQIQVSTDGDPASLQRGMLSAIQGLLSRTQFLALQDLGLGQKSETFNTTGTWTCPDTVYWVIAIILGGGGGGGGGAGAGTSTGFSWVGGGGGGGAEFVVQICSVTPGTTSTVTVGQGGVGGAEGAASGATGGNFGLSGADGTASSVFGVEGPPGQGGHAMHSTVNIPAGESTLLVTSLGGTPCAGSNNVQPFLDFGFAVAPGVPVFPTGFAQGGNGFAGGNPAIPSWNGFNSRTGEQGGAAGTTGTNAGSQDGGSGGGGGGAGSAGPGAAGGAGGNGAASVGAAGMNGSNAAANSGSGGGGGGGGGSGSSSGNNGGQGGNGGSGYVQLFWIQGVA